MTAEDENDSVPSPGQTLVLYDGVCGLCNWLVAFLIRRDRRDYFRFAPLQSDLARELLARHRLDPTDFDTVVVIAAYKTPLEKALTRSAAAVWSVDELGGVWKLISIAKLIPLPLREMLYKVIARYRYRVFGKYAECPLPAPQNRHKFLSGF